MRPGHWHGGNGTAAYLAGHRTDTLPYKSNERAHVEGKLFELWNVMEELKPYVCRPALRVLLNVAAADLSKFAARELSRLMWAGASQSCGLAGLAFGSWLGFGCFGFAYFISSKA